MRRFLGLGLAVAMSLLVVERVHGGFGDELARFTIPESGQAVGLPLEVDGQVVIPATGSHFGRSVDIDGNHVVVGTGVNFSFESEPRSAEEVYVYDYTTGDQPVHVLRPDDPHDGSWFGASVAVDGNLAIVGAPYEDAAGLESGAGYLFDITTGQQLFKFVPDDIQVFDHLGFDVAIDGNYAVVSSSEAEAAYVYDTSTGGLVNRMTEDHRRYGSSVAIDGNTLLVGATFGEQGLGGSVYAYEASTGNQLWEYNSQEQADHFGWSIDVSGDRAIVGAPYAIRDRRNNAGAVYILDTSTGERLHELEPSFRTPFAFLGNFGESVAIDNDRALVGVRQEQRRSDKLQDRPGAMYLFDAATGERLQRIVGDAVGQEPLLGNNAFGTDVAISGSTAVVGVPVVDVAHVADLSGPIPPLNDPLPPPRVRTPGELQPGDADQDLDFDQFDIVRTLISDKYKTGEPATWGEGDWDASPGDQGDPPVGNGQFDNWDLVASQRAGLYLSGPYDDGGREGLVATPIDCCGVLDDSDVSLVYDAETGELAVDVPADEQLTSINISSVGGVFTQDAISVRILDGAFDLDNDHTIFKSTLGWTFESVSFGNVAEPNLSSQFLLSDLTAIGTLAGGGLIDSIDLVYLGLAQTVLMPGDANRDQSFDQLDLVQVLTANKYLTGQPATWGEGDWDGWRPGCCPGDPLPGDGLFDQNDIIFALNGGVYLTGPYAALGPDGERSDDQTSIVYDAATGEVSVDAPADVELTSINLQSASGIFTEAPAENLGDAFDNDADDNIFKATFGGSFGSLSFGNVAAAGLSREFLLDDLTVQGSLAGGGSLGEVDLIYVPEPSGLALIVFGFLAVTRRQRRMTKGRERSGTRRICLAEGHWSP